MQFGTVAVYTTGFSIGNLVMHCMLKLPNAQSLYSNIHTGPQIRTMLMGEMMAMTAAETMKFSTAEDELYSLHADVAASMFSRQETVHLEEYVGGLTAGTRKSDIYIYIYDLFNCIIICIS